MPRYRCECVLAGSSSPGGQTAGDGSRRGGPSGYGVLQYGDGLSNVNGEYMWVESKNMDVTKEIGYVDS